MFAGMRINTSHGHKRISSCVGVFRFGLFTQSNHASTCVHVLQLVLLAAICSILALELGP